MNPQFNAKRITLIPNKPRARISPALPTLYRLEGETRLNAIFIKK